MNDFDVIVVGGGGAGMMAALTAEAAGKNVALVSKVMPIHSTTACSGGGINLLLSQDDPEKLAAFVEDTLDGAAGLGDAGAVEFLAQQSTALSQRLQAYKLAFFRDKLGRIEQSRGAGTGRAHICKFPGQALAHCLYDQLCVGTVKLFFNTVLLEIVCDEKNFYGVVVYDANAGTITGLTGRALVIATGGYAGIYASATAPNGSTGDGIAAAMRVGLAFKDPEFVQFHPTALAGSGILISDAARNSGAHILNKNLERFMVHYDRDKMELVTRDKMAIAMTKQLQLGLGSGAKGAEHLWLDLRMLDKTLLEGRLKQVKYIAGTFAGADVCRDLVPVRPAAHFTMGGLAIEDYKTCTTALPGIFACGECACVSVHGANRLGGNALMEGLVFGEAAGRAAAAYTDCKQAVGEEQLTGACCRQKSLFEQLRTGTECKVFELRRKLGVLMNDYAGVIRSAQGLQAARSELAVFQKQYAGIKISDGSRVMNQEFMAYTELGNMLLIASSIVEGAFARQESRGSHYRQDYPLKNDVDLAKHTLVTLEAGGVKGLKHTPVEDFDGVVKICR